MNLLLLGMSSAAAATVEQVVRSHWAGVGCVALARKANLSEPVQDLAAQACMLCVVDLAGLGWQRYSPVHESSLLRALAGRTALVLSGADGGGWPLTGIPLRNNQTLTWLHAPHSAERLQRGLAGLLASLPAASQPAPAAPQPEDTSLLLLPDLHVAHPTNPTGRV